MDNQQIYILPKDKEMARKRIKELEDEIQALGPKFHDVFNQTSETWHDNAPFEILRDHQSVLFAEMQSLKQVLRSSILDRPKLNKNRIGIGATVEIEDQTNGTLHEYNIAGEWTARNGMKENGATIISSKSPLAQSMLSKKVKDDFYYRKKYTINKIQYFES